MAKKLSFGEYLKTQRALKDAAWDQVAAAKALDISPNTLRNRIQSMKAYHPQLKIEQPGHGGGKTIDADTKLQHMQESKRATEAKYQDALKQLVELQSRLAELEWASNVSLEPPDWSYSIPKGGQKKSAHIPLLFFSDAQAGEVVRVEETDAPWPYDSSIFRQRYRKMISTTLDLALNHQGGTWAYPGMIYARGGDIISGGLHADLRELGEDSTVSQQVEMVSEEEIAGIRNLAEGFGKVTVVTAGAAGNHDRNTDKPRSKLAWARNYDRLAHRMMVLALEGDKRVSFHISKSPDIRFPIFEKNVLMTHGDKTGTGGGMGFAGPALPILRGWHKVYQEQGKLGHDVDMIMTGHYHYPLIVPEYGMSNGSFTGYTEYGKMLRSTPTPPMQLLTFWHPKHGLVDERHIYLAGSAK